jgi:nicotinamidase-related amidase
MIEVYGRKVLTTIEELVDPRRTALVVIDVQNDFCSEGGLMHELGKGRQRAAVRCRVWLAGAQLDQQV